MLSTSFTIAAGTAAKWLLVAKIMKGVSVGCFAAAPILKEIKKRRNVKQGGKQQ